jgi:proteic killer suppression protein
MVDKVILDKVQKDLRRLPDFIVTRLRKWARDVELIGLESVKKISGYHDEPLYGLRRGQRSIRLNRSYRAIYIVQKEGVVRIVSVEEVHKHDY